MLETPVREAESLSVQLTRVEGVVNLVKYQNDDVITRVTRLERTANETESKVQKLELEATARDDKAIALALALKEADKTYKDKNTGRWTPLNRVYLLVGILYTGIVTYKIFKS